MSSSFSVIGMSCISSIKTLVIAGALALSGAVADAAPVIFGFKNLSLPSGGTLTFSKGGLDLTVTSIILSAGTLVPGGTISQLANGIGVIGKATDDTSLLDSNQPREALLFTFTKKVQFEKMAFSDIVAGSRLAASLDGTHIVSNAVPQVANVTSRNLTGYSLGIMAVAGATGGASGFSIANLQVSAVPLPAGGLLLGSALLLPFLRRKRRA